MKILNIELANVEQTDLGFEHWVDVTYTAPILKETYTIRIMLLLAFETRDSEVLHYMINEWRRRDIIHHSILMYDQERREN
nr:MAG TPA: hypothetical protein [Caudoviricetes sp.]